MAIHNQKPINAHTPAANNSAKNIFIKVRLRTYAQCSTTVIPFAGIANDGVLLRPHIVKQITDADGNVIQRFTPQAIRQIAVDADNLQLVRQGLYAVVNSDTGTGQLAKLDNVRVAGKTGTAEYCDDLAMKNGECYAGRQPSHAWFAAYAPYEDPEIAILVFVYNGGPGSETAAPVAHDILQYYFERQAQPPETQTGQVTTP